MNIGILGTGIVGQTIGSRLIGLGHQVKLGSRTANNEKAATWVEHHGPPASTGTFAEAAIFGGTFIFNCTAGNASLLALKSAGEKNLKDKILLDVANPLNFSTGFPPFLDIPNQDSLGEQIQRAFPEVKVVKTLNTMTCSIQADPARIRGDHHVFVSGNNADAKQKVISMLETWGWKRANIIDLGDITTARGTERLLPVWLTLMKVLNTAEFNFHIATP